MHGRTRARWAAAWGALLFAAGCATNPVTGRQELSLVSSAQEENLGRQGLPAVVAEYGRYDEAGVQAYVDSVGQKLARVSHLPDLTWHFTVLDDPTVNAFAMPGGYIYITRGILAHLNSEAQLAGVLGHEIGHVTHRHTAEQMTQQQLYGIGFGVASVLSEQVRRYGQSAQQALGLLFLKYSRDHETEADELGVEYATRAGYDPREIPSTYAMLRRVSESAGQRIPSFMSTHPDPGDREARTRALAERAVAGRTGLAILAGPYVQRMEGIVYGRDPRGGYFEGARYYQPTMRFQMDFPEGWATQDSRTTVTAAAADQSGALQLSLADAGVLSPAAYVDQLTRAGKITGSNGGHEVIGGAEAWVGRVGITRADGTPATLIAAWIRRTPDRMFEVLGQAASGSAAERRILDSIRSLHDLAEPARLAPTPARVHVATMTASATLATQLARSGEQGVSAEETAVLNNLELTDTVPRGGTLKVVRPSHTH
jgi:predicted Zn-dependent protease